MWKQCAEWNRTSLRSRPYGVGGKQPVCGPLQLGGFTLVELLIVTVALAILSAIVIPSFNGVTGESRLSALDGNLSSMRKAIDLYRAEHGHFPGAVPSQGTCTAGVNRETATPGAAAFVAHLTLYTTKSGVACSQPDANSRLGPYLSKIPVNPITNDAALNAIQTGSLVLTGSSSDEDGGWQYDFLSGRIIADQPSYDER